MNSQLGLVRELIADICSNHSSYSRDFLGITQNEMLNLRKKDINSVFSDDSSDRGVFVLKPSFLQLIQEYQDQLGRLIINLDYEYDYRQYDFRMRIKQKDSIINKLFYYKHGKDEKGGIPINKCLNDLLGFRIVFDDFDHTCEEAIRFQDEIKLNNYKMFCYDASKGDYNATHLYFYGNNKYFPWELQIWKTEDVERNELAHKEHKSKREYINWPHEYKE